MKTPLIFLLTAAICFSFESKKNSDELLLHGYTSIAGKQYVHISFSNDDRNSRWVREGESVLGYSLVSFNPTDETATFTSNGEKIVLRISPSPTEGKTRVEMRSFDWNSEEPVPRITALGFLLGDSKDTTQIKLKSNVDLTSETPQEVSSNSPVSDPNKLRENPEYVELYPSEDGDFPIFVKKVDRETLPPTLSANLTDSDLEEISRHIALFIDSL